MSSQFFVYSQVFYSYFFILDIICSWVFGFGNSYYVDILKDWEYCWQEGLVYFDGEIDCIYESGDLMIIVIFLGKWKFMLVGSDFMVVWNLGFDKVVWFFDFLDVVW